MIVGVPVIFGHILLVVIHGTGQGKGLMPQVGCDDVVRGDAGILDKFRHGETSCAADEKLGAEL